MLNNPSNKRPEKWVLRHLHQHESALWWQCHWSVHFPPHRRSLPNGHTRSSHKRDAIYILHFVLLSRTETNTRLFTVLLLLLLFLFFLPLLPFPPPSNELIISERLQPNSRVILTDGLWILTASGFLKSSLTITRPRQKVSTARTSGSGLWACTSH